MPMYKPINPTHNQSQITGNALSNLCYRKGTLKTFYYN